MKIEERQHEGKILYRIIDDDGWVVKSFPSKKNAETLLTFLEKLKTREKERKENEIQKELALLLTVLESHGFTIHN